MYKRYITELINEEYRISVKEFKEWLIDNKMLETFKKQIKEDGIVKTAIDYSVMIATAKAIITQR